MMRIHVVLLVLIVFFALPVAAAESATENAPLSFAQRVAWQERIEDVYWSYRIWPATNPGPKPGREEILTRQQIAAKVEAALLSEAALAQVWGEELAPERIQAELDRIARSTRHPRLLRDVFAALDHDPKLIAECFVRPRLAERLVRERFAWDREIHRRLRARAEVALLSGSTAKDLAGGGAVVSESTWVRIEESGIEAPAASDALQLTNEEWDEMLARLAFRFPGTSSPQERLAARAGLGFSPLYEEADRFAAVAVIAAEDGRLEIASATWPKHTFGEWLQGVAKTLHPVAPEEGSSYTLPKHRSLGEPCLDDTWQTTETSDAPDPRHSATSAWTGTEMIVWGGWAAGALLSGGRYDPELDSWTTVSTSNAGSARLYHAAVWSGSEMLVFGGDDRTDVLTDGRRYDPETNSWTAMSSDGEPCARRQQAMVWTGDEMIVWSGADYEGNRIATGGRYDPASDSWTTTSTVAAPSGRSSHAYHWVDATREMLIWGGHDGSSSVDTGGRYCASGLTGIDFGDAADPAFPTLMASDGARHYINDSTVLMGAGVDAEDDGLQSMAADGDDTDGDDDEDGMVFTSLLIPGDSAGVDVEVSDACLLSAWVDFDGDGAWDGTGEQIFADELLAVGSNSLSFPVPASPGGQVIARFRVDTDGGLSYTGAAAGGEVEDHQVGVEALDYGDAPTIAAKSSSNRRGNPSHRLTLANASEIVAFIQNSLHM